MLRPTLFLLLSLPAFVLAGGGPALPTPAQLTMDPPTQAELDMRAALVPAAPPLIRGTIFYDRDGDGSPENPQCDRGLRELTVSLYNDVDGDGAYSPGVDTLHSVTVTNIIGKYEFADLPAPATYLVMLDLQDPDLPAGVVATTASPRAVALDAGQSKTADLGVRIRERAAVREVVLSEIAWAGTSAPAAGAAALDPEAAADEWIDLRNTTDRTIDLTGWTLKAADGTPNITLRGYIPPRGHYLLERDADKSAPAATADQIYAGTLSNAGEDLTLSDDGLSVIDRVDAWYAGSSATYRTMLRVNVALPGTDSAAWADGPVNGAAENSLADADGDTYPFSPNPRQAQWSLDCDDSDAGIHPGAAEILDFRDQNCNDQVDEGLMLEPFSAWILFTDAADATGPTTAIGHVDAALGTHLDAAATSIDVAIYDFNRANLHAALLNAHQRGVQVRVMGDDEAYLVYQPFYHSLEAADIPALYDYRF